MVISFSRLSPVWLLTLIALWLTSASANATPHLNTLHSFAALSNGLSGTNADGAFPPLGSLTLGRDGNFYGATSTGGSAGSGTIFKITPSGTFTTLYNFSALDANRHNSDGFNPTGGLVQGTDGNFYGTTVGGGSSSSYYGSGTVFKITPSGVLTTLVAFDGPNGSGPNGTLLLGSDGNFYGTTLQGGYSNYGTVFQVTPSGSLTSLASFDSDNGAFPKTGVAQGPDGNLYGTTDYGGSGGDPFQGTGVLYEVILNGFAPPVIQVLSAFSIDIGAYSICVPIFGSDGTLYGTTQSGSVFSAVITPGYPPSASLTTIARFDSFDGQGFGLDSGVIFGNDGSLYGTTQLGGIGDYGTIYRVTLSGTLTTLVKFDNADGADPYAGLTLGTDGSYYGTTNQGGMNDTGTIYRLTLSPDIAAFSPSEGPIGSTVTLTGSDLEGVTAVRFHDASANVFTANADGTQLTVTVPAGAEKGTITVTTPEGSGTSAQPFRVTYAPVITSFMPASGPVGTVVTITGTHLTGITRVRFHDADASVYSSNASGTQLTVTVPSGAATGTITLDNRNVLGTTSSGIFTVTP